MNKLPPELIERMAAEVVATPVPERDRQAVADLVSALFTEMQPLRRMNVGTDEPATRYDAGESA